MTHLVSAIEIKRYESFVGIRIAPTGDIHRNFHIAFVLDISGSMDGERLETVQRTLHLFSDHMEEADRVSIITYNAAAQVLANKVNRQELVSKIDTLSAFGGTNMESGILALAELDLSSVDAIFLLTDGEVNQGITSVRGLESIIRYSVFSDSYKIPVYTLGYGEDHNARLLQAIAVATRASYTFAESNEMIPSVVGSILVAMREEVAKAVTLEWEGEADCWEAGAVKGARSFCVGSLIANKPQWIILRGEIRRISICATGHECADIPLPDVSVADDLVVLEQWFRAEAVRVFSEIQGQITTSALAKLQVLENEIVGSPVAQRPLVLRIRAQIDDERALLDRLAAAAAMANGPMRVGHDPAIARLTSHMTALATQRGGPDFNSPSQRQVSNAMTQSFLVGDPTCPTSNQKSSVNPC